MKFLFGGPRYACRYAVTGKTGSSTNMEGKPNKSGGDNRDCSPYWLAAHARALSKTSPLVQMSSKGAVMEAKASWAADLSFAT